MSEALTVTILVHPELISLERLLELTEKLSDFTPVLEEIGTALEQSNLTNFETRGYGAWAELRPSTIAQKQQLGYGGMPDLVREGLLKASLTERRAAGHKFLVGADSVTVGVYGDVIPYANALAEGVPSHGLPARILINITSSDEDRIIQILTEWLGSEGVSIFIDTPLMRV